MVFDGLVYATGSTEHAGCGATHHDVISAHLAAIEHGVKGRHLQQLIITDETRATKSADLGLGDLLGLCNTEVEKPQKDLPSTVNLS